MSLPKLDLPSYKHYLVGLQQEVKYRPFTVKEQKILLRAKQTEEQSDQMEAMKQIIDLCTFQKLDVENLAFFDIEDLFLRIRAKSVSEVCEIMYKVRDTDERVKVSINLDDVKVTQGENHERKIMLTDDVGVMMKYPSLETISSKINDDDLVISCIDYVFDDEQVYHFNDLPKEEVQDWVDQFDVSILKNIRDFFDSMPRIRHEVEVELKDGSKETIHFEGIQDLFI